MLIDAQPDLTAFAALPREHRAKIRPQQPHRAPWAARPGAAQTSPRVLPDSDSARPLIGPALPEQRGVAVRRTTPPSQASPRRLTDMLHTDNSAGAGSRPALPPITT